MSSQLRVNLIAFNGRLKTFISLLYYEESGVLPYHNIADPGADRVNIRVTSCRQVGIAQTNKGNCSQDEYKAVCPITCGVCNPSGTTPVASTTPGAPPSPPDVGAGTTEAFLPYSLFTTVDATDANHSTVMWACDNKCGPKKVNDVQAKKCTEFMDRESSTEIGSWFGPLCCATTCAKTGEDRKNCEGKCLTVLEDDKCTLAISGAKPDIASKYGKGNRCEAVPEYRWWCDGTMQEASDNKTCTTTCPSTAGGSPGATRVPALYIKRYSC